MTWRNNPFALLRFASKVQGRGVAEFATSQYQHDAAFRNRYVGIRSAGPPANQRPTALL
jgi:hypothetical protein